MHKTHRLGGLAAAAVAAALAGCAGTKGPANIYGATARLPVEEAVLVFAAPGLGDQAVVRAVYMDNSQREEYALYRGKDGAQAEIFLAEASQYGGGPRGGDFMTLEFDKITAGTLALWNMSKAARPQMSDSFPHKGAVPYYLQLFKRQDTGQSCFGFHAEFNHDVHARRRNAYDSQLFGYYCAPRGTSLTDDALPAIVDKLQLVGTTVAATSRSARQKFQQLKQDPVLFAQVTQGEPAGQTGMAAFPLHLSRQYGPDSGGGSQNR